MAAGTGVNGSLCGSAGPPTPPVTSARPAPLLAPTLRHLKARSTLHVPAVPAVPCIPPPITRRPPPATPLSYFVSFELHHPPSKALAPTINRPASEGHMQLTLRNALPATTPSPCHHSHVVLHRANRLEQQGPARSYGCCLRRPRRNCHPWLPAPPAQRPALTAKAIKAGEQRRRTKL